VPVLQHPPPWHSRCRRRASTPSLTTSRETPASPSGQIPAEEAQIPLHPSRPSPNPHSIIAKMLMKRGYHLPAGREIIVYLGYPGSWTLSLVPVLQHPLPWHSRCRRGGVHPIAYNGRRRPQPDLNFRRKGGKRSPDGTEVDRSRKNGWDVSDSADPANDIGDDPPPNAIMRRKARPLREPCPRTDRSLSHLTQPQSENPF
jgi:hypothetical protein